MITRNFKNLLTMVTSASATKSAGPCVVDVNGGGYFLSHGFGYFPYAITTTVTLNANAAGISIGSGDPGEHRNDDDTFINLMNTITEGVSLTLTATESGCESPEAPYVKYTITITNTGSEAVTIREIGYKQTLGVVKYVGSTSETSAVFLLDRTVLDSPVTIQPGDAGVIHYRLQTSYNRTKAGVKLVSFTWGSDEEVADMIDAARAGLINLQSDGGWRVGDTRRIQVGAFQGGLNSHAAEELDIVISQFGDYNGCGCLFQFDFVECAQSGFENMNASGTNAGGYGASRMYTTTLPAMVEALPEWLRTRLKSFSVLVSKGSSSSEIESVGNNKLALRSEVEVWGTNEKSYEGEGTQILWYSLGSFGKAKTKGSTMATGGTAAQRQWWTRSPGKSDSSFVKIESNYSPPSTEGSNATTQLTLSPFGCV